MADKAPLWVLVYFCYMGVWVLVALGLPLASAVCVGGGELLMCVCVCVLSCVDVCCCRMLLWCVSVDDVCRATVAVISSGDEADLAMLTPFVERLLTRYGDRIEILHRAFVPEDKPGIRLLEIW